MTPAAQHPQRCETCDNYDLRDTVKMGEWVSVGTCCGKIISDYEVKFMALKGCASHSSAQQQRIGQVIMKLQAALKERSMYEVDECIKEAIALLQAEVRE